MRHWFSVIILLTDFKATITEKEEHRNAFDAVRKLKDLIKSFLGASMTSRIRSEISD